MTDKYYDLFNATELLYSLKNTDAEIKKQLDKLEELRGLATSITVSTDKEAIQTSSSKDKIGGMVAKIVDLENEIKINHYSLLDRRTIAKNVIFEINSECYQNILYDYFIRDCTLGKVAELRDTRYNTIKYQLKQAIKAFEKIFDSKKEQKIQDIAMRGTN